MTCGFCINEPPLSVNEAWQGKRFKTPKYKSYEKILLYTLPRLQLPETPYTVKLWFGFSSKLSDIDNPTKLFLDIICKKYGFDDREIYRLEIEKQIVKKGQEFIKFEILHKDIS